jgi:putative ABC transport system permease protein
LESLGEHKMRSALTMLGMMFGVGAVIAMLSIGAGAEKQAMSIIDRMGIRNVLIRALDVDKNEIEEAVPNIDLIAPRIEIDPYKVLAASGKSESKAFGVSHRQDELVNLELAEGRFLDSADERNHEQVAVIGSTTRRDLFGADPAIGRDIKVNDVWLEVVGVLAPESDRTGTFQGVSIGSTAEAIYIPFTTALRKFDRDPLESPLKEMVVRLEPGASPTQAAVLLTTLLDRLHGGAKDYELVVPEALLAQSRQTQNLFNIVMGCIAGISLLVGGIGIMNIMLASVLEQTREIGIRRAVGARRRDIRFQFLVASFTISLLGGVLGIGLGIGIARVVATYAAWPTVVAAWSIALSTGVSVAVGLISGIYPAIRAANLDPIVALHSE